MGKGVCVGTILIFFLCFIIIVFIRGIIIKNGFVFFLEIFESGHSPLIHFKYLIFYIFTLEVQFFSYERFYNFSFIILQLFYDAIIIAFNSIAYLKRNQ